MTQHDEEQRVLDTFREMARLQARVCYMNVDRTLATWTRTALTLIVCGIAVDRFGLLLLHPHFVHAGTRLAPNPESSIGGIILVALGTIFVAAATIRHQGYKAAWIRRYGRDDSFGPWLAFPFAVMVAALGIVTLAILLVFAR